jgi:ABC-type multidrug transport system permease subunit
MKAFARELAWFFVAIVVAAPIAYFFGYLMNLEPEGPSMSQTEEVFQMELFIIGGIIGFVSTYLMRIIIWAVAKFLISE